MAESNVNEKSSGLLFCSDREPPSGVKFQIVNLKRKLNSELQIAQCVKRTRGSSFATAHLYGQMR